MATRQITFEELANHNKSGDLWIGIHGKVYDVSGFLNKHPGGPYVLLDMAGRDATDAFDAYHPEIVQRYLKAYYVADLTNQPEPTPMVVAFRALRQRLIEKGAFKINLWRYVFGLLRILLLLLIVVFGVVFSNSFSTHIICAFMLGLYFQQIAFFGHDLGHNTVTGKRKWDSVIGVVAGNFLTGISIGWWKKNHNVHHIVCNSVENDPDIQHLPFLSITDQTFETWWSTYYQRYFSVKPESWAQRILCWQHFLYYPLMAVARLNLYAQSLLLLLNTKYPVENREYEFVAFMGFVTWLTLLVSSLPTWEERILFVCISHSVAGILHVQICLSHFSMTTYAKSLMDNWVLTQVLTTLDISCPWWMDWFHGGLQFQIEHHLFPRIPRYHLRGLKKEVRAFCKEFNLQYHEPGFVRANQELVQTLYQTAQKAHQLSNASKTKEGKQTIQPVESPFVETLLRSPLWDGLHARG